MLHTAVRAARSSVVTDARALAAALSTPGLSRPSVLDSSFYVGGRDVRADFSSAHIPTASFFDVEAISDAANPLPHMLPSADHFGEAMAALGVSKLKGVVVYDTHGFAAAARAFWMLRAFGHEHVHILNGGLPRWTREGHATEAGPSRCAPVPRETWTLRPDLVSSLEQTRTAAETSTAVVANVAARRSRTLVVDARPAARFDGTAPEPRPVPSGHIAGARSVPAPSLVNEKGELLGVGALRALFKKQGVDVRRDGGMILSCGSGVQACALWASLLTLGRRLGNDAVYDGSWTEWVTAGGAVTKGPAEKASSDYAREKKEKH